MKKRPDNSDSSEAPKQGGAPDIQKDVIGLIAENSDNPTLSSLSLTSKLFKRATEVERIHRLFSIARQGGLEEVKLALQKGTSQEWLKALLTTRVNMGWEDRAKEDGTVEVKQHRDKLLQLAHRMRDKEMFDVVKAALDKLDPEVWIQQIKDFEGEQADCLDEMDEAYAASCAAMVGGRDDLGIQAIGGAELRCFKNMPWVMHRMLHRESGWDEESIDKSFKRDVKYLTDFCSYRRGPTDGGLGITWFADRGCHEKPRMETSYINAVGSGYDEAAVTKLKSKCVSETQAIQSQLSESKPAQT